MISSPPVLGTLRREVSSVDEMSVYDDRRGNYITTHHVLTALNHPTHRLYSLETLTP